MWPNLPNWINIMQMSSIKAFFVKIVQSLSVYIRLLFGDVKVYCFSKIIIKNQYKENDTIDAPFLYLITDCIDILPNCNFQKTEQSGIWINYLSVVLTIATVLLVFHCQNCKDLQSFRTPLSIICSRHIFCCCRCCNPPPSRFFIVPFKIPNI